MVRAIEKSLIQAQKLNISVIKQQEILAQLHHDISQPIDLKFKKLLSRRTNTRKLNEKSPTTTEEEEEEAEFDRQNPCHYFFELISRYYLRNGQKASEVHALAFHHLITNHHFPSIYALLFHRWLFAVPPPPPPLPSKSQSDDVKNSSTSFSMSSPAQPTFSMRLTLSRCNIFLKGTNRLFWSDVENYTFKYKSLFTFLKQSVLLNRDLDQLFQFMELPTETTPSTDSTTQQKHKNEEEERRKTREKLFDDLGDLGQMGGDIDVRIGGEYVVGGNDDEVQKINDVVDNEQRKMEEEQKRVEEAEQEDDICDPKITTSSQLSPRGEITNETTVKNNDDDNDQFLEKMSREEQMAHLTSEEWYKRRFSQTEDTKAQFKLQELQLQQALLKQTGKDKAGEDDYDGENDKETKGTTTTTTRHEITSPELQHLMDKNKQRSVIESKKRDLISLVAKYFFYYEDRNSRMQLPRYISDLASKYASNMMVMMLSQQNNHHDHQSTSPSSSVSSSSSSTIPNDLVSHTTEEELLVDEYDEISQLDEVGGWASLFDSQPPPTLSAVPPRSSWASTSSSSANQSQMIDYRRFSITDPSFNEMFDVQATTESKVQQMISDIFVTENIFLLSVLNNEKILVSIMNNFKLFKQLDISSKCKVKLQAALYAATRPGPPNYPGRTVRHKAQEILDSLFPKGKYIRFLMNSSFRVLHHFTWPMSILYWWKDCVMSLFRIPSNILSTLRYHFVFDPKHVAATPEAAEPEEEEVDEEDHYYLTKFESL